MKIKKINIIILTFSLMMVSVSCDKEFLDINEDPNNPTSASLDLLLPAAQIGNAFWTSRSVQRHASIFVRQYYNLGPSTYNIQGSAYGNDWNAMYRDALNDFKNVRIQAEELGLTGYAGISKVHTAFIYSILVDLWGDVPFSQALQGAENTTPKFDQGSDVYNALLSMLDDAKVDLQSAIDNGEVGITSDVIYGASSTQYNKWIKAANTLKLRLLLNLRLVDEATSKAGITTLINENNFIDSNGDDFQFQFSSGIAPMNQHPIFQQEYISGSKNAYMSNYFMYNLISKADPRLKYYIFRQGADGLVTFQTQPCATRSDCEYGWLGNDTPSNGLPALGAAADGYIGRDHGDPSGIPGDNTIRATFGVYPIGGSFDDGSQGDRTPTSGGKGAGISIFETNFNRAFMLAEAALTLGVAGDVTALLEEGIRASISKVMTFGANVDGAAVAAGSPPTSVEVDAYVDARIADYTAATTDSERLDIIIKEMYYANFGNGIVAYNAFRRTGFPSDLPTAMAPNGPFPNRFPYTPGELSSNPNAPNPAPTVAEKIFWAK